MLIKRQDNHPGPVWKFVDLKSFTNVAGQKTWNNRVSTDIVQCYYRKGWLKKIKAFKSWKLLFNVTPQRLELWTHRLRVCCSTNWATESKRGSKCITIKKPEKELPVFLKKSFILPYKAFDKLSAFVNAFGCRAGTCLHRMKQTTCYNKTLPGKN